MSEDKKIDLNSESCRELKDTLDQLGKPTSWLSFKKTLDALYSPLKK